MVELDHVVEEVLKVINDNGFSQKGAFNLRQNGTSICHGTVSTSRSKEDGQAGDRYLYRRRDKRRKSIYPGRCQRFRHDGSCI